MPDVFIDENQDKAGQQPAVANQPVEDVYQANPPIPAAETNNSVHLLTSFCKNPGGVTFQNQEEGEKILLFIRKDFITNTGWIIAGCVLALIPLFLFIGLQIFSGHIPSINLPLNYVIYAILFYYLLVATYLYLNFITWYFNISLITDRRVVDIDFASLVYKNVAVTKLELVQDVSYTQVGVLRTFFDFGNVLVQTAGTIDNFEFDSAPKPEEIVHVVEDLIGKNV